MPNRGTFGSYEDTYKNLATKAAKEVESEMIGPLKEYLDIQSASKDSLRTINGDSSSYSTYVASGFSNNDVISDYSNSTYGGSVGQSRGYQRVLTKPNSHDTYIPRNDDITNNGYYHGGYSGGIGDSQSGSTQTLVLIYTAILVVLVITISLVVMKYLSL